MAKINELTDTQLEKALIQYRSLYASDPSDKTNNIIQQLQLERQKRQSSGMKEHDEDSELSKIARSAEAAVKQKLVQQEKGKGKANAKSKEKNKEKNDGGISFESRVNNSKGAKLDTKWSGVLLCIGWACGLPGLILFFDAFVTHWISEFPYMTACAIVLMMAGVASAKVATYLSNDNT